MQLPHVMKSIEIKRTNSLQKSVKEEREEPALGGQTFPEQVMNYKCILKYFERRYYAYQCGA